MRDAPVCPVAGLEFVRGPWEAPALRAALQEFADEIFPGLSFRRWSDHGYWKDNYRPVAWAQAGRLVAVSAATAVRWRVNGRELRAVQLGTIGTRPDWRGRGLAASLVRWQVEQAWASGAEQVFLYAHAGVADFYPKLGFRRMQEHRARYAVDWPPADEKAQKFNREDPAAWQWLDRLLAARSPASLAFGCEGTEALFAFHALEARWLDFRLLPDGAGLVAVTEREGTLRVTDLVARERVSHSWALQAVAEGPVHAVLYDFTPDLSDLPGRPVWESVGGDDLFFVQGPEMTPGCPCRLSPLAQA